MKLWLEEALVPLLQEGIQMACVNSGGRDSGGELRSARLLDEFFRKQGRAGEILSPPEHPERASYFLRLPGVNRKAPSLMFLGHLDVVPADPAGWSGSPFEGTRRSGDGFDEIVGRGAVDMLNTTMAMAAAVGWMIREGFQPRGDLLFLAAADEEAAGTLGARWLTEEHWDKEATDYLVTGLRGDFPGRTPGVVSGHAPGTAPSDAGIALTSGEKGVAWLKLEFSGTSGHGSLPLGTDNAGVKAAEAVQRLVGADLAGAVPPLYRQMVEGMGFPSETASRLLSSRRETREKALRELLAVQPGEAQFLHAASGTTVSPNVLRAGEVENQIPGRAELRLDIRTVPGQTRENLLAGVQQALGPLAAETTISFTDYWPAAESPREGPLYHAVRRTLEEIHPGRRLIPFLTGGVTDARFFRAKGTVAYGITPFSPRMALTEFARRIHGRDERVDVDSLAAALRFFRRLPEIFGNS